MEDLQWVRAVGELGLPTVAAGVMLVLFVRQQRRESDRVDRLTQELTARIVHGDGNGSPSLARVVDRLDALAARLQAQEDRLGGLTGELGAVRAGLAQQQHRCDELHGAVVTELAPVRRRRRSNPPAPERAPA
ncbi:MAG: hypothetical protein IT204_23545 [Fimbriimonadaceae bacterium]|nr:hypothetical protein [Fimbriimonadaceae bacterium]